MNMEIENLRINSQKIVEDYISEEDWRARENANSTISFSGLLLHAGTTVLSNYALKHLYPKRIADAHYQGFIHIHDLGHPIVGYCCGHPLRTLLVDGLKKMSHVESAPPKHFTTALDQMVNYLGVMQHEWSGAMAFNSPDTLLAPFIAYDTLSEDEVKQALQSFIFHLNMPSRWGGQLVFSNLTLDITPANDLKEEYIVIGGEIKEDKYGDFLEEQEIFNKNLFDIFYEGDANGRIFSFPIPTINITKDFPWESEISDKIFKLTAKYGTFYFSNFLNSNLKPSDIRSMCCRLSLNLNELRQNITGGLFGSSDSTGSIGVCTLNLNRIGYLANDENEYFMLLDKYLKIAKDSLEIKREMIQKTFDAGLIPLTKHYIGGFKTFFSTIGILGMNESLLNFMDRNMGSEKGIAFTIKVMKHIRMRLLEFQEETGNLYSLEASPAESASLRLALLDRRYHSNIITAGTAEIPFLTNSTQLPVDFTDDPFEAMQLQEPLQTLYNSGTVQHLYIGETNVDYRGVRSLIKRACETTRLPYISFTPTFSNCPNHGYISGNVPICPKCGEACEVYSRVVGYYRPISQFNRGKQIEFAHRKTFNI